MNVSMNAHNSAATATKQTSSSSSSSSSSSTSSASSYSTLSTTFMSLLMAELKNQDPTSPMNSAEMVGQMVNLNQLNTLLNIQSILTNALGTGTSTTTTTTK